MRHTVALRAKQNVIVTQEVVPLTWGDAMFNEQNPNETLEEYVEREGVLLECSSLDKVAKAFAVPRSRVIKWRKTCPALQKRPYSLGDIAFDLSAKKIIPLDSLPNDIKKAVAVTFALESIGSDMLRRIVPHLNHEEIQAGDAKQALSEVLSASRNVRPLLPTESAVISVVAPRTAALFADRVWTCAAEIPAEIGIDFFTPQEAVLRGLVDTVASRLLGIGDDNASSAEQLDDAKCDELLTKLAIAEAKVAPHLEKLAATAIGGASQNRIVPFMSSQPSLQQLHVAGSFDAISVTISALEIVDESQLTWDLVQEFRKDQVARTKLRRFIHWLDGELDGESLSYVHDEIALRLDEYRNTIQSWGIKTVRGIAGALLDVRAWMSIFCGAAGAAHVSPNQLSAAVGAVTGLSLMGFKVSHDIYKINLEDAKVRATSELAYLHDIQRRLPGNKKR